MFGARGWLVVLALVSGSAHAGDPKPAPVAQVSREVLFNVKTHKFHAPSCEWARKCTRHCVRLTRDEAQKRGGVPCKVCGGR